MEWKNQQTMHPTVSQKILLKHSSRKYWVWVIAFLIKNLLCLMGLYYLVFACVIINIMLFGFASNSRNILRYLVPRFETHKVNLSSYGLWFIKKRRGPQHRTTTLWQSPSEYVWVMSYQLSGTPLAPDTRSHSCWTSAEWCLCYTVLQVSLAHT